jgi:aminomethyltransferase
MTAGLKQTALHAVHVEMGAKMVDFAGWSMPVHYGSQLEEHGHVRSDAGMFDVSHMLALDFEGAGAHDFLRRVFANDVGRLQHAGKALYTCMLGENGGVLDDLIVYAMRAGRYRAVVNAGTAAKDRAWLAAQRAQSASQVEITPRAELAIIAVQGPRAREKFWAAFPEMRGVSEGLSNFEAAEAGDAFIARTGYTGEDGFEIMIPAQKSETLWRRLAQYGVAPAGLGARDTLRLEAGMNLYGQDMDEQVTPFECGLAWTVDLKTDREFIGRHALERSRPEKKLVGLVLHDRGVMRAHQRVRTQSGEGDITSGGFSPTMNRSIALARVAVDTRSDANVEIEMRGKWLKGTVVQPPFVRHGKVLVEPFTVNGKP